MFSIDFWTQSSKSYFNELWWNYTQNFIRMARHKVSRWIIFFIIKAAFLLIVKLNSSCAKKDDRHDIEHPFLASASIKLIPHKKEACFLKIKAASRITRSEICKPFFASKLTAICLRCCCYHNNTKDDLFCNICTFLQCASLLHYLNFSWPGLILHFNKKVWLV